MRKERQPESGMIAFRLLWSRVGIYAHAVKRVGFRQPEIGLGDKNAWAASARLTLLGWMRKGRQPESRMIAFRLLLLWCRVGIYAHAVKWVGFRQPEIGLGDKNAWAARAYPTWLGGCAKEGSLK